MKLELDELEKEFGGFVAVDHVSLSMTNGAYGLLGANGAGKTTLMRMLCTLVRPTGGGIRCDGRDIFKMGSEYRDLLGYLPQDFGFYPEFTVRDYLCYIASIKGIRPALAKKRAGGLIDAVGLARVADKKLKKLSGGMKRRAGIAQAMINDPRILILDEPTAGLDPGERMRFRGLLSELSRDRLVLLSTHIVSDVEYIANEILMMKGGAIVSRGTPGQVIGAMPAKVWSCRVPLREAAVLAKKYRVSNMKSDGGGAELRIISEERPCEGAVCEQATLEDAFLYYLGERGGDGDDLL